MNESNERAATPNVTKWTLTTDPVMVRRMGKTGEECAELLAVTARIQIQGIDESDPGTGKTNRQRLIEEIADVYAQLDANIHMLGLDVAFIDARRIRKLGYMREWEALYVAARAAAPQAQPSESLVGIGTEKLRDTSTTQAAYGPGYTPQAQPAPAVQGIDPQVVAQMALSRYPELAPISDEDVHRLWVAHGPRTVGGERVGSIIAFARALLAEKGQS